MTDEELDALVARLRRYSLAPGYGVRCHKAADAITALRHKRDDINQEKFALHVEVQQLRMLLLQLHDALEETYSASPEGRAYLKRIDAALNKETP